MKCAEADAFIHAYVDGELQGRDRDAYEQHLLGCDACSRVCRLQGRFKAAVRGHLPRPEVPERVMRNIHVALAGAPPMEHARAPLWRRLLPVLPLFAAAAAGVTLYATGTASGRRSPALMQALRTFQAELPMDVVASDCAQIMQWFRGKVDFTPPARLKALNARCVGGRLVPIEDHMGAYVVYEIDGRYRIGMMVFPGEADPLPAAMRRPVRGHDVYMDRGRGASMATFRDHDGLNYVITGDMDQDALTNIIDASFLQR